MNDHPEELQRQIDQTKASLVGKLEALQEKVSDTVESTSETVATVEDVVHSVAEKVHAAGEFLNLRHQIQRHPWWVFGSAITVGCLGAYFLGGGKKKSHDRSGEHEPDHPQQATAMPQEANVPQTHSEPKEEKKQSSLRDRIGGLMGLGVGSIMGVVRDLATRGLSEGLGKEVAEEVDRWTTSIGGKPIEGPIVNSETHPDNQRDMQAGSPPNERSDSKKQPAA